MLANTIFVNQNGQDSLEYVAMGLIAIILAVLAMTVLKPLIQSKSQAIESKWGEIN